MGRKPRTRYLFLFLALLFVSVNVAALDWQVKRIDDPKYFELTNNSVLLDALENPHVFYGGHHLYHSYYNGSNWNVETIDAAPDVGMQAKVIADKNNKFHVLYVDTYLANYSVEGAVLKYATNKNGNWEIELLPINTNAYTYPISFDVDDNGFLYIAYVANYKLYYATNLTTEWVKTLITEQVVEAPKSIALRLDGLGKVHIAYHHNDNLVYTTNKSGVWLKEIVDQMSVAPTGDQSGLFLDGNGYAHIAYWRYGLKYASNSSGAWVNETIDENIESLGFTPSIVLDNSGTPHISYWGCDSCQFDYKVRALRFAVKGASGWNVESIDTDASEYFSTSLALDSSGRPLICYLVQPIDSHVVDLRFAARLQNQWLLTTVDTDIFSKHTLRDESVGVNSVLNVDDNGHIHVAYRDGPSHAGFVKYASNKTGDWQQEDVQQLGDLQQFGVDVQVLSQTIDKLGYTHVIYQPIEHKTYYATNRNGQWEAQIIESQGAPLAENAGISVAIDDNNAVHTIYYLANGDLRYAHNDTGMWQIETISNIGKDIFSVWIDHKVSMFLDANGNAHVGFTNQEGDLIYASNQSDHWELRLVASFEENHLNGHTWNQKDFVILPGGVAYMVYASANCIKYRFCVATGLEYATNSNGKWRIQKIDYEHYTLYDSDFGNIEQSYSMVYPSISINHDQISVSYHVEFPDGLVLRAARNLGGIWSTMFPDSNLQPTWWSDTAFNNVFSLSSIANRNDGGYLISYLDLRNKSLNLAKSSLASSLRIEIATNLVDYNFGNVENNSSETAEVMVKNVSATNLTVNNVYLIDNSGYFSAGIQADQDFCRDLPVILPPGEQCVLLLNYEPTVLGKHDVAIRTDSDDADNPVIFTTFSATSVNSSTGTPQKTQSSSGGGGGELLLLAILIAYVMLRWACMVVSSRLNNVELNFRVQFFNNC